MGKYAPVLKAAECGSMTRAAQSMGYTQPSLGYIINNIENELGVKIFYRDKRGVTPTEAGIGLLEIMRQIEAMENHLQEAARVSKQELLRVGILSSVASQWMPEIFGKLLSVLPRGGGEAGERALLLHRGAGGEGAQAGLLLLRRPLPHRAGEPAPLRGPLLPVVGGRRATWPTCGRCPSGTWWGNTSSSPPTRAPTAGSSIGRSLTASPSPAGWTSSPRRTRWPSAWWRRAWASPCCRGSPCWTSSPTGR